MSMHAPLVLRSLATKTFSNLGDQRNQPTNLRGTTKTFCKRRLRATSTLLVGAKQSSTAVSRQRKFLQPFFSQLMKKLKKPLPTYVVIRKASS
jgi:hypothetical protein